LGDIGKAPKKMFLRPKKEKNIGNGKGATQVNKGAKKINVSNR
jgi:hypothetical protein